jgi:hypothetical protein
VAVCRSCPVLPECGALVDEMKAERVPILGVWAGQVYAR